MDDRPLLPTEVYMEIFQIPVTEPAVKAARMRSAARSYRFLLWQIEELREQWAFCTPQVEFPLTTRIIRNEQTSS